MTREFNCNHPKEHIGNACAGCLALAYEKNDALILRVNALELQIETLKKDRDGQKSANEECWKKINEQDRLNDSLTKLYKTILENKCVLQEDFNFWHGELLKVQTPEVKRKCVQDGGSVPCDYQRPCDDHQPKPYRRGDDVSDDAMMG